MIEFCLPSTAELVAIALEREVDSAMRSNPCNLPSTAAEQMLGLAILYRRAAASGEGLVQALVGDPLAGRTPALFGEAA